MLLSSEEELSLLHFSSSLSVSKNTVLRDMKYTQKIVNDYHLEIEDSYHIDYEELSDTKEFEAAEILIEDAACIPKEERLFIGDKVTSETTFVTCRECEYCLEKDYHLCAHRKGIGHK
jgi:transcriptional antiterminator